MLFQTQERRALVEAIHRAEGMIVLAVTGGGIAVVADLLMVPGASRTVLDVQVPYSEGALWELTAGSSASAVSPEMAQAMATQCYQRALTWRSDATTPVFGVACTAALVTDRERRGADHACIAVTGATGASAWDVQLEKRAADEADTDRVVQDRVVADHVLRAISETLNAR